MVSSLCAASTALFAPKTPTDPRKLCAAFMTSLELPAATAVRIAATCVGHSVRKIPITSLRNAGSLSRFSSRALLSTSNSVISFSFHDRELISVRACQQRLDARHKPPGLHGFEDVIVRAGRQCSGLIVDAISRREHQDGDILRPRIGA